MLRNKKGFAIPMTFIFMFFSQIMYMSLLSFNQIQSTRYQGMINYYQGQIQFMMGMQLFDKNNAQAQIEQYIENLIFNQTKIYRDRNPNMTMHPYSKQLQIFSNEDQSHIMILEHRIFLERQEETGSWKSDWVLSGTLDTKRFPVYFKSDIVSQESESLRSEITNNGYRKVNERELRKTGNIWVKQNTFNSIKFKDGYLIREDNNRQTIISSFVNGEARPYKKIIDNDHYYILVNTVSYHYAKND